MASWGRKMGTLAMASAVLALTVGCLTWLTVDARGLVVPLLAHVVHLASAFVAGCTLMRLPRVAPREVLDIGVVALVLGMALLALLGLVAGVLGLVHPATPWACDAIAVVVGLPRLRPVLERLVTGLQQLDLSVVATSRIPLYAALCALALPHLVPPFMPPTSDTGAVALALAANAAARGDLAGALHALPGVAATPSTSLLLLGWLSGGAVGARLFALTWGVLLACGVHAHGRRHLGSRSAAWAACVVASAPATMLVLASDPSAAWLLLCAGLAFCETSDWCEKAVGGKIALASVYGGLAVAESARGLTLVAGVLLFVFVVQALMDRHGLLRQVPGVLGMAAITLVVAAPFVGLETRLSREPPVRHVVARYASVEPPTDIVVAATPVRLGEALALPWGDDVDSLGAAGRAVLPAILELGPLLVGLLLFVPLVPQAPPILRGAVVAVALGVGAWMVPEPWGCGVGIIAPAVTCAGASALAALSGGARLASAVARVAVIAACVASVLVQLRLGPDTFAGAAVVAGKRSVADFRAEFLPDHELAAAVVALPREHVRSVLLVGQLTDCAYETPVTRRVPEALLAGGAPAAALRQAGVSHVAVDRETARGLDLAALASLRPLGSFGAGGRHELWGVGPPGRASAP
jgi:hypothetical protein